MGNQKPAITQPVARSLQEPVPGRGFSLARRCNSRLKALLQVGGETPFRFFHSLLPTPHSRSF